MLFIFFSIFPIFPIFFFGLFFGNTHQLSKQQAMNQALPNHTSNFCLSGGEPSGWSYACVLASFQYNVDSVFMCASLTLYSNDTKFIGCSKENRTNAGVKKPKLQFLSSLTQNPDKDYICTHGPDPNFLICVSFIVHGNETNVCGYSGHYNEGDGSLKASTKMGCIVYNHCEAKIAGCQ